MIMKKILILFQKKPAGYLTEENNQYNFTYLKDYKGPPISLTLPLKDGSYQFDHFPSFFDGLLPEGIQLEGLLKIKKLDRYDYMGQLLAVGNDLVGAITVCEKEEEK